MYQDMVEFVVLKCAVLKTVKIVEILCKKLACSHSQSFSRADRKWL